MIRFSVLLGVASSLLFGGCAHTACEHPTAATPTASLADVEPAVRKVLADQVIAWNRGDLRAFFDGYEHSEDVVYASTGGFRHGWQESYDRFLAKYPDPRAAGELSLVLEKVIVLGPDAALTWGHWKLDGASPQGGVFSLVLRRGPAGFGIIHDHTSLVPPVPAAPPPAALPAPKATP